MSYFVVDVESDGALLGENSMVCFGAVMIDPDGGITKSFYGLTAPISEKYNPEALAISGFSREEHEDFTTPEINMIRFKEWINKVSIGQPILVSDNNGYDASWINWYFLKYVGSNPFGWSSRRIGDMFCGFYKDAKYQWKKHRITKHTHHPVDDAKGNAEALVYLQKQGYKIKF